MFSPLLLLPLATEYVAKRKGTEIVKISTLKQLWSRNQEKYPAAQADLDLCCFAPGNTNRSTWSTAAQITAVSVVCFWAPMMKIIIIQFRKPDGQK